MGEGISPNFRIVGKLESSKVEKVERLGSSLVLTRIKISFKQFSATINLRNSLLYLQHAKWHQKSSLIPNY